MKTETLTLAAAMDVLAREIRCADGLATAAIAEAAQRLRELEWEIAGKTKAMDVMTQNWIDESRRASELKILAEGMESKLKHTGEKIEKLTVALKDAISTYNPDRDVTLVTAERQEAWAAALN